MMTRVEPIQINSRSLIALLETMGMLQYYSFLCKSDLYSLSHHVQYEKAQPVALGE